MFGEERRGLGMLVLLSSAGCLGLPRYSDDGAEGGGDRGDDGTATHATDEGPEPGPTSSNDDAVSFVYQPDMGPVTSPTTATTDSGDTPDTDDLPDTDGPPVTDACLAFGNKVAECYDEHMGEQAIGYCAEALALYTEYYGPDCGVAFEDFVACLSSLSCEELTGPEFVCQVEYAKLQEVCSF